MATNYVEQEAKALQLVYTTVTVFSRHSNGKPGQAVYGELAKGSFRKVVNFMIDYMEFDTDSLFLDVGSGGGKPNFHVAQDPGVKASIGIEVDEHRWKCSMDGLNKLKQISQKQQKDESFPINYKNCFFINACITSVQSFDPFTHVYMFSTG